MSLSLLQANLLCESNIWYQRATNCREELWWHLTDCSIIVAQKEIHLCTCTWTYTHRETHTWLSLKGETLRLLPPLDRTAMVLLQHSSSELWLRSEHPNHYTWLQNTTCTQFTRIYCCNVAMHSKACRVLMVRVSVCVSLHCIHSSVLVVFAFQLTVMIYEWIWDASESVTTWLHVYVFKCYQRFNICVVSKGDHKGQGNCNKAFL